MTVHLYLSLLPEYTTLDPSENKSKRAAVHYIIPGNEQKVNLYEHHPPAELAIWLAPDAILLNAFGRTIPPVAQVISINEHYTDGVISLGHLRFFVLGRMSLMSIPM